ncbi:MOSC domain-containing protein [Baaleninema sp.]|uniref:MOSC domain-containing protein n=1 Tax=Baaleninema sp. TaxID=3101197 RepID=UPI003D0064A6
MQVQQIFIHPVKGLTPQAIARAELRENGGMVGDRALGLMFVDTGTGTETVVPWQKKQHFAVQNDWPQLAALSCHYDFDNGTLMVEREGKTLLSAKPEEQSDRDRIGEFFTQYLQTLTPSPAARHPQPAPVRLVGTATGKVRYLDRQQGHISIISQSTFNAIAQAVGLETLDPRRFRPNFVIDGLSAWEEFQLVGHRLQLGSVLVEVTAPIGRCFNINVNPDTGEADLPLLDALSQHFGQARTGVIAKVLTSGTVTIDDDVSLSEA